MGSQRPSPHPNHAPPTPPPPQGPKDYAERRQARTELRQLAKEERKRQERAVADVLSNARVVCATLTGAHGMGCAWVCVLRVCVLCVCTCMWRAGRGVGRRAVEVRPTCQPADGALARKPRQAWARGSWRASDLIWW